MYQQMGKTNKNKVNKAYMSNRANIGKTAAIYHYAANSQTDYTLYLDNQMHLLFCLADGGLLKSLLLADMFVLCANSRKGAA